MQSATEKTLKPTGTILIEHDTWSEEPDSFMDGLIGDLYIWHKNYSFGHDTSDIDVSNCATWCDHEKVFRKYIKSTLPKMARIGNVSIEPVYMYSHSGDTISRSPFGCRWDSGQVGFFVVNPYQYESDVGWDVRCKKGRDRLMSLADTTFEMWRAYVEGNVILVQANEDGYDVCYGEKDLSHALTEAVLTCIRWPEDDNEMMTLDEINKLRPLIEEPTTENINQLRQIVASHGYDLPTFMGDLADVYGLY